MTKKGKMKRNATATPQSPAAKRAKKAPVPQTPPPNVASPPIPSGAAFAKPSPGVSEEALFQGGSSAQAMGKRRAKRTKKSKSSAKKKQRKSKEDDSPASTSDPDEDELAEQEDRAGERASSRGSRNGAKSKRRSRGEDDSLTSDSDSSESEPEERSRRTAKEEGGTTARVADRGRRDIQKFTTTAVFNPQDIHGTQIHRFLAQFEGDFAAQRFNPQFKVDALVALISRYELARTILNAYTKGEDQGFEALAGILIETLGSSNAAATQRQLIDGMSMAEDESARSWMLKVDAEVALFNQIAPSGNLSPMSEADTIRIFVKGLPRRRGNTFISLHAAVSAAYRPSMPKQEVLEVAVHHQEVELRDQAERPHSAAPAHNEEPALPLLALSKEKRPHKEVVSNSTYREVTYRRGGTDVLSQRNIGGPAADDDDDEDEPAAPAGDAGACFSFQNTGSCRYGAGCRFTHAGSSGAQQRPAGAPKRACFHFARGACTRGSDCIYSHAGPGNRDRAREQPRPAAPAHEDRPAPAAARGSYARRADSNRQEPRGARQEDRRDGRREERKSERQDDRRDRAIGGNRDPRMAPQQRDSTRPATRDEPRDSRNPARASMMDSRRPPRELCREFLRGDCNRGAACRFAH